jgi:hypothetical protein
MKTKTAKTCRGLTNAKLEAVNGVDGDIANGSIALNGADLDAVYGGTWCEVLRRLHDCFYPPQLKIDIMGPGEYSHVKGGD